MPGYVPDLFHFSQRLTRRYQRGRGGQPGGRVRMEHEAAGEALVANDTATQVFTSGNFRMAAAFGRFVSR
jgi:hypothetical protein